MTAGLPDKIITAVDDGVLIRIHLQPRASRTEICGIHGDELKVRVTSPPVDDAANRLCIEFFAGILKVAKSRVVISAGSRSRHKTIRITGVNRIEATAILSREIKIS